MATVRIVGLEPTRPKALEPKSSASAKFRQMRFTPTRPARRADSVIASLCVKLGSPGGHLAAM